MGFQISKYIAELLEHYGQVRVKGLGTFVSNKPSMAPAQPGESFNLNPKLDEDILLRHVIATTQMELSIATKLISDEVALIKKEIDNGALVYLEKIGHLYRNHKGKFIFLADKDNFNAPNFVHPELKLEPMTDQELAEVKALIKKPNKTLVMLSKKISTIAPIAVLLLACILTWSLISTKSKKNKDNFSKNLVSEKRVNTSPIYEPPVGAEKKKDIDGVLETDVDTESATTDPNAKECVIIVGQFKSKEGASKRLSDIYDFGYAAYQDQANGLTRVGIQFPYENKSEIREVMRKVKKRFDLDSWILKE